MPELKLEPVNRYNVRLFVGGCVERGDGSSFRAKAHAHVVGQYKGWICIRSWRRVLNPKGRISVLVWHEVAHCLVGPSNWHNGTWRRMLQRLISENRGVPSFDRKEIELACAPATETEAIEEGGQNAGTDEAMRS